MKRRSFLKTVGTGITGTWTLACQRSAGEEEAVNSANLLPRRLLGQTGEEVSVVGFPGLALANYDQEQGTQGIHRAFDQGVNYFDVAPAYGNGDAELKMGVGLQGLDRGKLFLANKTKMRDREGSREELERSLSRLKTDYFDLYQLHHLRTREEVEQALGPNGAIETLVKAKEEGKVRFLGFSAHTTVGALAAMEGFDFHTVMFPINFVEYYKIGFGKEVLELAEKRRMGVISIKAISMGAWPEGSERTRDWWYRATEDRTELDLAMGFALSNPIVASGIPPSFLDLLDKTIASQMSPRKMQHSDFEMLKTMAGNCHSLFQREEERVASGRTNGEPVYPDSPHECFRYSHA